MQLHEASCNVRLAVLIAVHVKRPWHILVTIVVAVVVIAEDTQEAAAKGTTIAPWTISIVALTDGGHDWP